MKTPSKKEADLLGQLGYTFVTPDLPKDMMEECLGILDNLDSRKSDKVNWEERHQMDEVTKRSGNLITHEEASYDSTPSAPASKTQKGDKTEKKTITESKPTVSPKEEELLKYLDGVMGHLEGFDGKK